MKKILATVALIFPFSFGCAAQSLYVLSSNGNVNLRTAPSKSAAKAGTLTYGELAACVEELDGWYKISYNGKDAYVSNEVSTTCDAFIPQEMYKQDIKSSRALDKIRFQGSLRIDPIDKTHVMITTEWMRVNLPAETTCYLAEVKDGMITATHAAGTWVDCDSPISAIMEEMFPLDKTIPVGFDEFNNTIYFNGGEYSEFE